MHDIKPDILILKYRYVMESYVNNMDVNEELYNRIIYVNMEGMLMRKYLTYFNKQTKQIMNRFNIKKNMLLKRYYKEELLKIFCYDISIYILSYIV